MSENENKPSHSYPGDPKGFLEHIKFRRKWIGGVDERDVWQKIKGLDLRYQESLETNGQLDADIKDTIQSKRKIVLEKEEIITFGKRLVGLVLVLYIIFGLVFGLGVVSNNDMSPKLSAGDIMFYYRLDKTPESGDVILLKKEDQRYIGRVVAKPGDTIEIKTDGGVVINGGLSTETEIYFETKPYDNDIDYPITLKENEYFILCDHRSNAKD